MKLIKRMLTIIALCVLLFVNSIIINNTYVCMFNIY